MTVASITARAAAALAGLGLSPAGAPSRAGEGDAADLQERAELLAEAHLAELEARLAGRPPATELAALRHRLAEARLAAVERAWLELLDFPGRGRHPPPDLEEHLALVEASEAEVVFALATVLLDDPAYPRRDEVLWGLAEHVAGPAGRAAPLSQDLLLELVGQHPDSPLAAEAWIRLGDLYLLDGGTRDPAAALQALDAALATLDRVQPRPPEREGLLRPYSRYKRAWALFLLDREHDAIWELESLAREGLLPDPRGEGAEPGASALGEEALRDALRFLCFADRTDEAVPLVASLLREPRARDHFLRQVATFLEDHGSAEELARFEAQRAGLLRPSPPPDEE